MFTVLADPLGTGTLSTAVADVKTLITGTYAPILVGAIIFSAALGIGFRWLNKGARKVGKA